MKVCQIVAGTGIGGLEKHVIELSQLLQKKGIEVTVIAHESFRKEFLGINFIPLDLTKSRKNIFILYKLFRILKKHQFDIIHTQANKATDMAMMLKNIINIKIVSTLHSYKKNISSYEKADFVITVSNKIGKELKNPNKTTIYNGIDFFDIEYDKVLKKFNIPNNKFLVCSAGRLCDVKKFDILIKSLKDLNIFCILIGDGEKKEELINLAKKHKVNDKILFTGNIDNLDVKRILKLSNLSIITSQKEGFSYFFAESLIYKTPIVSTDVADIKDFIGNKYIIPFNDYEYLSEKIISIKDNYLEVEKDFEEVFKLAEKEFTLENMVNKTIRVYKNL